ncbi:hypothetical protein ACK3TF_001479 [Chlorella vulgaris]
MQRSCRTPPPCAADGGTSEPLSSSEFVEMQRQAEQTFNAAQGELRALEDRVNTTAGPKSQSRTVESPNGCYWQRLTVKKELGEEGSYRPYCIETLSVIGEPAGCKNVPPTSEDLSSSVIYLVCMMGLFYLARPSSS